MLTFVSNGAKTMDWTALDGDNSPTSSSTSSSIRKDSHLYQDVDSFSEEDDLSDDFSFLDSDDERKNDPRVSHHLMQVRNFCNFLLKQS